MVQSQLLKMEKGKKKSKQNKGKNGSGGFVLARMGVSLSICKVKAAA